MSFQKAASLPVAFLTAYFSLIEIARLQRTQSVLIHAAAGGVGQAVVMIAQHLGAEVFTTVSSPEKRELMVRKYGIPADHIFNSRDKLFGAATLAVTKGRGVNVVLNSLAGPLLQESFNLVALFEHLIEIDKRDLKKNRNLETRLLTRSIFFSAVDLLSLLEHRENNVYRYLEEMIRLIKIKAITSIYPIIIYIIENIVEVSRLL